MCGILGTASTSLAADVERSLGAALESLAHRGPEARAAERFTGRRSAAVLGHTRLRIIDLRPEADQPMTNEDETIWVDYNGELYNVPELRRELEAAGHRFRSRTDTELLVHLYEQVDGDAHAMLRRLRGMFAFALFDRTRDRLLLARDRLGIKPMYWTAVSGGVAFASEVRALVRAGFAAGEPDDVGLSDYVMWGRLRRPRTILRGVTELPPGSFLEWTPDGHRVERWWEPVVRPDAAVGEDARRLLRATLEDAVGRHLVADRPVGVFLSGGIDSTSVASTAARIGTVRTLTVEWPDSGRDEGAEAAAFAKRIGVEHEVVPVRGADVARDLERIVASMDQPTADGANTWLVCRAAHEAGLVVALSGVGGDELFGGYPSFRLVPRLVRLRPALDLVSASARGALARAASARSPGGRATRALTAGPRYADAYAAVRQLFSRQELEAFGVGVRVDGVPVEEPTAEDPGDRVMLLEATNYLPNQLLRDTDQMAMAHSLEVRVPLLDDAVVRVALALPSSVRNAEGKALLAGAAGVPRTIKRPFTLPFERWMRGPLREPVRDALLTEDLPFADVLPLTMRRTVWDAFERRRIHWSRPWSLAVLRMWPGANGFRW